MFQEIYISLKKSMPLFSLILIPFWVGSYGGEFSHILDLVSNFKLQMFYGAIVVLICNLLLRNWKTVCWSVLAFASLGYEVMIWSIPYRGEGNGNQKIKIYYSNVLSSNRRQDLLFNQIHSEQPDLVALLEINHRWNEELDTLRASFPHEKVIVREDNFGLALFSKYELNDIETLYLSSNRIPSMTCKVNFSEDRSVQLLITHPYPPIPKEWFRFRNSALERLGQYLSEQESSLIMVGDLNITMWSPYYKRMMASAPQMYNARQGFGVGSTWPSSSFTRIPIDHCFLSKDLKVKNFEVLKSNGSDHLPVVIEILQ